MKMHLGKRDYVCQICKTAFYRIDGLNKHMKRVHPNDGSKRPHKCDFCVCTFSETSTLKRHVTVTHKNKKTS